MSGSWRGASTRSCRSAIRALGRRARGDGADRRGGAPAAGALGDEQSALEESFADGLLDCPQYTRPEVYQGARVPEELLSGHHGNIRRWRLSRRWGGPGSGGPTCWRRGR